MNLRFTDTGTELIFEISDEQQLEMIFNLLADAPTLHGAAAKAEELCVPVLGVLLQHRLGEVGSHPGDDRPVLSETKSEPSSHQQGFYGGRDFPLGESWQAPREAFDWRTKCDVTQAALWLADKM